MIKSDLNHLGMCFLIFAIWPEGATSCSKKYPEHVSPFVGGNGINICEPSRKIAKATQNSVFAIWYAWFPMQMAGN